MNQSVLDKGDSPYYGVVLICGGGQIIFQLQLLNQIITVMNPYRKANRPLMPHNENMISPDLNNKYMAKSYPEPIPQNCMNQPQREFVDIPDLPARRNKTDDPCANYSISQINLELDKNADDIMKLLRHRKGLVAAKKKRMMEDAQQKLMRACNDSQSYMEFMNDQDFIKITNFCQNTRTAVKMLGKIIQTIPEIKGPRIDEEERSEQFWSRNRKLENDIDIILQKLKIIDNQLQKQNGDVLQICRELDRIEDTLKSFVGAKSSEHVQKVEPLFLSKKKNYDLLNRKIKDRQISKDKKIEYTKRITNILEQLKRTREERLEEIAAFFGIENSMEFDRMNFKDQGDFGNGLEQLLKAKERNSQLEVSEKEVLMELQLMSKDQDRLSAQLMKSLSDEAKAFQDFNNILAQRIRYTSILAIFENKTHGFTFGSIDSKEYLKKFKEIKTFFKRFIEEDALLKQGLMKTSETAKTFYTMLRTTQSQKQRRQDLLGLLQACIRKRAQYEQKREELRNIQFEESRNDQEMTKYEEDMEGVLTDGDLDGYKKIGSAIGKCQNERVRLSQVKELIQKQMESMDRDMVSIANRIQEQYQDILSDVLPSDFEYSLKSGQDVKKLRNQLRRMYKRLGLLSNE